MYADIILPLAVVSRLSYHVPKELEQRISIGSLVTVPMGKSTIYRGIVVAIGQKKEDIEESYKDIISIDREGVSTISQLEFWEWIKEYYCCQIGDVMRRFIPSTLCGKRVDVATDIEPLMAEVVSISNTQETLNNMLDRTKKAKSQHNAICKIVEYGKKNENHITISIKELTSEGVSRLAIRELQKRGFIEISQRENPAIYHRASSDISIEEEAENQAQQTVAMLQERKPLLVDGYISNRGHYLLSLTRGMTEGKSSSTLLLLVPSSREAVTLIDLFRRYSPLYVVPYHSGMSSAARKKSYLTLAQEGGLRIVIGTKEAIGLPFSTLDGVVVDQEHSDLYKQEHSAPTFNARDCSVMLARGYSSPIVLISESPSMESMHNVSEGKYSSLLLGLREQPKITIIDRRSIARDQKRETGEDSYTRYISNYLFDRISESISSGDRVLLFHARRGFSQYLLCEECGEVVRCPHCNVSLTYHKAKSTLECHYCSHKVAMRGECPSCHSERIKLKGVGTENIEERIREAFPSASVCRIDSDSASKGASANHTADIVIGTQMVKSFAEEGSFALSAVINSDTLLNIPDFRATERAMRLISELKMMTSSHGEIVIQGTLDQSPYPAMIRSPYRDIYPSQITDRSIFAYPPVAKMVVLRLSNRSQERVAAASEMAYRQLKLNLASRVSPPEAPFLELVQGEYRRHILIKIERGLSTSKVKGLISEIMVIIIADNRSKGTKVRVDVDPVQI